MRSRSPALGIPARSASLISGPLIRPSHKGLSSPSSFVNPRATHRHMLKGQRILVTGGRGFLGSHVVEALVADGCPKDQIAAPSSAEVDLTDRMRTHAFF